MVNRIVWLVLRRYGTAFYIEGVVSGIYWFKSVYRPTLADGELCIKDVIQLTQVCYKLLANP